MKVLIVDDSRFLRLMNERALVKVGHQVLTASDGEEGLRLTLEHKPDLVVLDMLLPRLSGREVLRAMRKDAATAYFEKSLLALDKGSGTFVEVVERMLTKAKS